jgi:hypothetical protein
MHTHVPYSLIQYAAEASQCGGTGDRLLLYSPTDCWDVMESYFAEYESFEASQYQDFLRMVTYANEAGDDAFCRRMILWALDEDTSGMPTGSHSVHDVLDVTKPAFAAVRSIIGSKGGLTVDECTNR